MERLSKEEKELWNEFVDKYIDSPKYGNVINKVALMIEPLRNTQETEDWLKTFEKEYEGLDYSEYVEGWNDAIDAIISGVELRVI